jgi:tetratricopeptide (TPR) repeat protein
MSLLLEALKKAEKAKQDAPPAAVSAPAGLSLEEGPGLSQGGTAREPLPEVLSTDSEAAERHAADQLFATKNLPSRRGLVVAGAGLLAAALAGGAYLWYQTPPPRGSPVAVAPRPAPPPAQSPPPAAAPPQAAGPVTAAPPEPPATPAAPAAAPSAKAAREPARPRERAAPAPRERAQAEGERIRLQRTQRLPQVDPGVAAGYDALLRGEWDAAQANYSRALRADSNNRDALLGLAATAVKRGDEAEAQRLYRRVLELDPRDPLAHAGLMGLRPPADPAQAESRLRLLLAQHPEAAALHFALGNLLAAQARWAEAQQEYFRAFSLEPASADYAFNLAVSLDQIGQRRLAAEHYRKALALGAGAAAGFDRGQAERRLGDLEAPR